MANEQGYCSPGWWTIGMSASWLYRHDLWEDTHDDPDDSEHCFISFKYQSPFFVDETGYQSHTMEDFITTFYDYVTDGYSIDDALDIAANCFGSGYELEDTWLYSGYWFYTDEPPMQGWYWCYLREFGDGDLVLTT
jgi:hypothetical protein